MEPGNRLSNCFVLLGAGLRIPSAQAEVVLLLLPVSCCAPALTLRVFLMLYLDWSGWEIIGCSMGPGLHQEVMGEHRLQVSSPNFRVTGYVRRVV